MAPLAAMAVVATMAGGCTIVSGYGVLAAEQRRLMNDQQARATMAALCDIALGSYYRELTVTERRYASLVCGGDLETPVRLEASEP